MGAVPGFIPRTGPIAGPTSVGTPGQALTTSGDGTSDWQDVDPSAQIGAAIAEHVAAEDPHTQYLKESDAGPLATLTGGATAIAVVDDGGSPYFVSGTGKEGLFLCGNIDGVPDFRQVVVADVTGAAAVAGTLAQFAATTSAQLAGVVSNETGYSTGAVLVFSISPTITTPVFVGVVVARQSGGVAGTDEVQISHDGTRAIIESKDGAIRLVSAGGQVTFPDGTVSAPGIAFTANPNVGFYQQVPGATVYCVAGVSYLQIDSSANKLALHASMYIGWASSGGPSTTNPDTGLARDAAGVVKVTNASTSLGSFVAATLVARQSGGVSGTDEIQVSHDGTHATITNKDATSGAEMRFVNTSTSGYYRFTSTGSRTDVYRLAAFGGGFYTVQLDNAGVQIGVSKPLAFTLSGEAYNAPNAGISNPATGVIEVNNGTHGGAGKTLRSIPLAVTVSADAADWNPGVAWTFEVTLSGGSWIARGLGISQVNGQKVKIRNMTSGQTFTLPHQDGTATAANRFICTSGADIVLSQYQEAEGEYSSTLSRWVITKRA